MHDGINKMSDIFFEQDLSVNCGIFVSKGKWSVVDSNTILIKFPETNEYMLKFNDEMSQAVLV